MLLVRPSTIAALLITMFFTTANAEVKKGIDVRAVQTMLAELCYNPGPIDGAWGKKTEAAVSQLLKIKHVTTMEASAIMSCLL